MATVVYGALKRNYSEVYFHKDKNECDFIIKERLEITTAIQVTVSLENSDTAEREFNGIIDAMKTYKLKSGLILTKDETAEKTLKIDGVQRKIVIKPVWKWLLEGSPA